MVLSTARRASARAVLDTEEAEEEGCQPPAVCSQASHGYIHMSQSHDPTTRNSTVIRAMCGGVLHYVQTICGQRGYPT